MAMDRTDEFIAAHARSMSQQEMADRLGVNKSTVCRRMKALREAGKLDAPHGARGEELEAMRASLKDHAMTRSDRLAALYELKDILHAELELSGGAGLARVSSEYRQTIEQIEALSEGLTRDIAKQPEISGLRMLRLRSLLRKKCKDIDSDTIERVYNETLIALHNAELVYVARLDLITAKAEGEGEA